MAPEETPVDDIDESQEVTPFRYTVTSYGADYPVDGLVKRLNAGDIVVPYFDPEAQLADPIQGYQRQFVWTKTQCDRFVESLLLGLPVPGIFLVKRDDGKFLVLDGQQRLRTLQAFYKGVLRDKAFALHEDNVQKQFASLTYENLPAEDRRRLDDSIIHATIVRQDEPSDDQSSVYLVFERLNTGGTSLQPQEVRIALYGGGLMKMLRKANELEAWRKIYGSKSKRFKDQELILRFFAFLYWHEQYTRPMKDFLNRYAAANKNFQIQSEQELEEIFRLTTETVFSAFADRAFRLKKAINAAVMDSVMVGIAGRIKAKGKVSELEPLRRKYDALLKDSDYLSAVERATADEESVKKRLRLATQAFVDLE